MALILEVRDVNGVATLHRLNSLTLTIGRALTNDVILDDPYVDARHARIAVNPSGGLELHDTGSVNGLFVGNVRSLASVPIQAGVVVRVGRSTLRFRDINEEVAPALADELATTSHQSVQRTFVPTGANWQRGILCATVGVLLLNYWLNSTTRDGWTPAISGTIGVVVAASVWSVIWGATTRGADRKLNFARHLVITSAALLALLSVYVLAGWSQFLFPAADIVMGLLLLPFIVVFMAWIAEHLGVSTMMSANRRWRAGGIVMGSLILIAALAAKSRDDKRPHDEASIDASLKPVSDRFVPTITVPEFAGELSKLQKEVDKLLDE
ncbi:MAG: FHA domain-containing protein [Phycisphaerae bacterium]|nr:FHA domain-containing protein [Gemmatimonadaceae bacterium]